MARIQYVLQLRISLSPRRMKNNEASYYVFSYILSEPCLNEMTALFYAGIGLGMIMLK